jgi:hypothetical protein
MLGISSINRRQSSPTLLATERGTVASRLSVGICVEVRDQCINVSNQKQIVMKCKIKNRRTTVDDCSS